MTELLTAKRLEGLRPPKSGRIELTDSAARGLKFRLTAGGSATWSILVRVNGRQRRFQIGEYPAISLAEARKRAGRLRAEALDGRDPIDEKRKERRERIAREGQTVRGVLEIYSNLHLSTLSDGTRRGRSLSSALSKHKSRPIKEISRADLQAAIDRKAQTAPVAANRLCAALSHFCGWLFRRGYLSENVGDALEKPTRELPRERLLSLEEIARIWRASEELDPVWGCFARILILTAQRRGDVAGMRWDEVDHETWSIPGTRTKNRRPHIVHLAAATQSELNSLLSISGTGRGLVFTTTGSTPISGFTKFKRRLDEKSGVSDWTLHDIRTAFATHCADSGIPESIVDRVLNHAASASRASTVARVYQRSELISQRAQALEQWANLITRKVDDSESANILEFHRT